MKHNKERNNSMFEPVNPAQGVKHDTNKPSISLIPSSLLWEMAKVLDHGAEKYAPHNWRKGIHLSRLISAAMRHIIAFNEGENMDKDSGLPHLAHAACEIAFALEQMLQPIKYDAFDDRYIQDVAEFPIHVPATPTEGRI